MKILTQLAPLAVLLLTVGCGPTTSSTEAPESQLHFIGFGGTNGCTLNFARAEKINVCFQGTNEIRDKAQDYTKRALLTWLRALKQVDQEVKGNIEFTCSNPHLTINMIAGSGVANASCGRTNVYTQRPYGTYLHEFGHAVAALGDTYTGRSAGACRAGQPKSVMCWGAYGPNKDPEGFNLLYEDDVKGIQAQYKKKFPNIVPPNVTIDPLAPMDPNNPWPTDNGQPNPTPTDPNTGLGKDIFVALGPQTSDRSKIYVSTRINLTKVIVCEGTLDAKACAADASRQIVMTYKQRAGDRKIYESQDGALIDAERTYTILAGGELTAGFNTSDRIAIAFK